MIPTPAELVAMRRAIAISAFGIGTTSRNPPVGCVILDGDGHPVGEGHHVRKGEPHAEAHALAAAREQARGGTAVVTLEPCNHHGRTPPCHQALIDAGVRRILVAVVDPTSRGEGGIARLRAAGLDVVTGVLADEARLVLGPWLDALDTGRPHVTWAYRWQAGVREAGDDEAADRVVGSVTADELRQLHADGIRRMLVTDPVAGLALAEAGLVDRIVVHLDAQPPSHSSGDDAVMLPPGYRLVGVERVARGVQLVARSRLTQRRRVG